MTGIKIYKIKLACEQIKLNSYFKLIKVPIKTKLLYIISSILVKAKKFMFLRCFFAWFSKEKYLRKNSKALDAS